MSKPFRILLIDDDEEDYILTQDILEQIYGEQHSLDWVDNWEVGLEIVERKSHELYLVDYGLGERNGLELLQMMIERGCDAPIILLTGMNSRDVDTEAMITGAADYLRKGELSPSLLEKSIRYSLARQQFLRAEHEAKELLRQINEKLGRLYKTAYQFVDNVSHEFRTPLTVIKEFAAILQDGLAGEVNNEQSEYLGIILNRVDDLSLMTNDMLDFSLIEAGILGIAREEIHIEQVFELVRTTLERKAAASESILKITTEDALPTIYCDAEKIGRVIINLAVNAFKFSSEGGKVSLWARNDAVNSEVIVGVTDDGPGMAPEHLDLIFNRFQQVGGDVRASTKGFGLGLNIAKELVEINFGTIEVESRIGEGSSFKFTIPSFEPVGLLRRYMRQVGNIRDGSSYVSLVTAHIDPMIDAALRDDVKMFIERQVRRSDLLFDAKPGPFLICAATNQTELGEMIQRLLKAKSETDRDRPDTALPEIEFGVLGTWHVGDEGEQFVERFAAEFVANSLFDGGHASTPVAFISGDSSAGGREIA